MSHASSSPSTHAAAPLLFVSPTARYETRVLRLRALAEREPSLRGYLSFVAQIVEVQYLLSQHDIDTNAPTPTTTLHVDGVTPPLSMARLLQDRFWQGSLTTLLAALLPLVPPPISPVLERLRKLDVTQRTAAAHALFDNDTSLTGNDGAPFVWAALSLNAAQRLARSKIIVADAINTDRALCPLCGNAPVAGVVRDGQRYLHCRLCESEWLSARAPCSHCGRNRNISTRSLEKQFPTIKVESCGDCRHYLKIFTPIDDDFDAVADDLANMALDARLEQEGYQRSSINPFLFSAS